MEGVTEFDSIKDLEKFIKEHNKVLVVVKPKGGCRICEIYAPIFKATLPKIFDQFPDVSVAILWYEEGDECLSELDVCSPTIIFYKEGKEVDRLIVETVPETEFSNAILEKLKNLG